MTLLLRPLSPTDEPAARQAHAELAEDGFELLLDLRDGELRVQGLHRVLVTCDDANLGSAAVIERCGGVLSERPEVDGVLRRHYWFSLS